MGDLGFQTYDEIIRQRAVDGDQSPVIAYPKTELGISDYELFTGRDLNRLVDGAAKSLIKAGLEPVFEKYEDTIVGIYGISDLDYAITIFGLGRLGYTTFLLSPRLPLNACIGLLQDANASVLIYAPRFFDTATKISQAIRLQLFPVLGRSDYDNPDDKTPPFARSDVDNSKETLRNLIMMHSSGSTGLPRSIGYTHKRLMVTLVPARSMTAFLSLPLYHAQGFVILIQGIYKQRTVYLFNGNVAQTSDTVTAAIMAAKPEMVWTVPYVLKLLAEKKEGIEALKACKLVCCSGSRCSDDLGNLLVREGIHFGINYGATEVALLLTSLTRPREDKAWEYLRPLPHVAPFIRMKPVDGNICECVVLDGHRGKAISNSNDPPNSYHTKDLFTAHHTIPNAFKYVGRLDDRLTLTNGEKVLPLGVEGRIQQDPLVKEAVMFGIDRPVPGLLLFRAKSAAGMTDKEFIDRVWPAIEDANSRAEKFSQISKETIAVIPDDVDCPSTDKSSIQRAQVYREFASVIDDVYTTLENSAVGTLKLSIPELEKWIISSFEKLGIILDSPKNDFFAAGVDSLKAIQMRGVIIKNLDLGGNISRCSSTIVYDSGNAAKLARALYNIRTHDNGEDEAEDETGAMLALIEQYSVFNKHVPGEAKADGSDVMILTGATGFLGAHILTQLVNLSNVRKVYCLVRTFQNLSPSARLTSSLLKRNIQLSSRKIVPLSADLAKPDLGLSLEQFSALKSETTHIIHCAWEVNFVLPMTSFTPQLAGLQNLLQLSLSVPTPQPARLLFCSSVGTAMGTSPPAVIQESPLPDLTQASGTGYARSKLVAERVVEKAVREAGARGAILRIGQIVPGRKVGSPLWNPNDAVPLVVRAALTIGMLPETLSGEDGCTWLDADTLANVLLELGELGFAKSEEECADGEQGDEEPRLVYNVVHPRPFSWRETFLPRLRKAGLQFETVPYDSWLERLAASEQDMQKNPSVKLLAFWKKQAKARGKRVGGLRFETAAAEKKSRALREAESVVEGNMVETLVDAWRKAWQT